MGDALTGIRLANPSADILTVFSHLCDFHSDFLSDFRTDTLKVSSSCPSVNEIFFQIHQRSAVCNYMVSFMYV